MKKSELNSSAKSSSLSNDLVVAKAELKPSQKGDRLRLKLRRGNRKNKKITRKHPEFELTYDMMLGIRTMVNYSKSSRLSHPIRAAVFGKTKKLTFPKAGSNETAPHEMNSFKFKDYCPEVFRDLRKIFMIDPDDYMVSLCSDFPYLEFVSNSNSGQFFFYSYDRRYMIKTQTKRECSFLRYILPTYYDHCLNHRGSLITQFLGLHRVKRKNHLPVYFVIMTSVFQTNKFIHEVYDLKGSTQGRSAKYEEKNQEVPILKDNDFVENGVRINFGEESKKIFFKQLTKDCDFLTKRKIMDYSLILGVHFCNEKNEEMPPTNPLTSFMGSNQSIFRRQSVFAVKKNRKVKSPYQKQFRAKNILEEQFESNKSKTIEVSENVYTSYYSGILSNDKLKIYYIGIIDILQVYNIKKRFENKIKSLKYNKNSISAVSPKKYAERLLEFLDKHVD